MRCVNDMLHFLQTLFKTLPKESHRWSKVQNVKRAHSQQKTSRQSGFKKTLRKIWRHPICKIISFPLRNKYCRIFVFGLVIAIGIGFFLLLKELPSPRNLTSTDNFAVSSQIFDRNGELLYEIFGDEHRIPMHLDDLPPYVAQATVAIEDERFYAHFGVDLIGIVRAAINNARGNDLEGGSTITQQLVKNALLSREKTLTRKAKEAILAVTTEVIYSKKQILEMYLNYISYGGNAVGIEAASELYFDKSAKDLTLAQAALLAGLPQAPSTYSPFGSNPERAKARQATVLDKMVKLGYISNIQAEEAKSEKLQLALTKSDIQAPHFVFYVRDLLYQEYGVSTVEKGGLRVRTTLDLSLQKVAEASVAAEVAKLESLKVGNGAALIVKPNTGEILSMVGSRDYFDTAIDGQVNVTLADRQPGSSIKPLMYATAFQNKLLNPGSMFLDVPSCFDIPGQKQYCPKNYDGSFRGPVTIRQSLGNSLNIAAVKGLKLIGIPEFMRQATAMGITTWKDASRYGLSLTLGGGEVRMIDLAQAFSVLANQGVKTPLTPILSITNYKGDVFYEMKPEERIANLSKMTEDTDIPSIDRLERVMDRGPAYLTSHIMQDNTARQAAFGNKSKLIIPNQIVSVKTGTTNDLRDNWTIGFTPEFLVVVWVGNNDGSPMNQYLVSGVTGAAPIWNDIMSFILKDREPVWQEKPDDVASAEVCLTGMPQELSDPTTCATKTKELFWQKSQPSLSKIYRKDSWIHSTTGLPLVSGDPTEDLVLENHTFYSDPLTPEYCVDCSRPIGEDGKPVYEQFIVPNILDVTNSNESVNSQSSPRQ